MREKTHRLYIESIYDGHFSLAQIGKKLLAGYDKLGGAADFGASLTQAEVDALARDVLRSRAIGCIRMSRVRSARDSSAPCACL